MKSHTIGILAVLWAIAMTAAVPSGLPAQDDAAQGDDITYTMPQGWIAQPVRGAGPDIKAHYALYYQGMPYGEMYLSYQPLAGPATLEQIFEQGLAKVRPNMPYYRARGTQKTAINGIPAIVHQFSYMPGGTNVSFIGQTYTMIAGTGVYAFFFQTVENYFQAAQSSFGQVMATVKANPRPAAPPSAGMAGGVMPGGGGLVAADLGLNFDLPPGWQLVNDPVGAKYRQFDAAGSQFASLFILKPDELAGLGTLFGAPQESAAEEALATKIERVFKKYAKYVPLGTVKRKIAGYGGLVHDFNFEMKGHPVFYRWCAFVVPQKSDKPSVVVAPEVRNFAFFGMAAAQADTTRKEWDAIIDSMRPEGTAAPVKAPAANQPPQRSPAGAAPQPKNEGGLPALIENQADTGIFADPDGHYVVKLPDGAVHQKTENNAAWFKMPAADTFIIIHNCRTDETANGVAARLAAGKKSSGAPTILPSGGREAKVSLYTAQNAKGETLAWVLAAYQGTGLLIVVNLPAKDYTAAQAWIGGLLRGVKFNAPGPKSPMAAPTPTPTPTPAPTAARPPALTQAGALSLVVKRTPLGRGDWTAKRDSTVKSPDGRRIAFISSKDGKSVAVIDGEASKPYDAIATGALVFSPDGKRVAYSAKAGNRQFIVADGVEGKRYNYVGMPVFSPDSRKLGYCATGGSGTFVVINGTEGKHYDDNAANPVFSSDGTRVAFTLRHGKNKKVRAVVDGAEHKPYDDIADMIFSANSKRFAYRAKSGEKWLVVVDGSEGRTYDSASHLIFSPNSAHFVYVARRGEKQFVVHNGVESKEYAEVGWIMPLFSPDSAHLAYMIRESGKQIMVVNGERGKPYDRITNGSFKFSPDSKRWAHAANTADGQELIVINGVQGKPYKSAGEPFFSPDSKRVAHTAGKEHDLIVVDGAEGKEYIDSVSAPAFSLDSKHVAYVVQRHFAGMWHVVVDGVETEEGKGVRYSYRPVFSDSRSFHFLTRIGDAYTRVEVRIQP